MCEYCQDKKGINNKSLIETDYNDPRADIFVEIGYSEENIPAIVMCSYLGMKHIEIKFCPICGKNLKK